MLVDLEVSVIGTSVHGQSLLVIRKRGADDFFPMVSLQMDSIVAEYICDLVQADQRNKKEKVFSHEKLV